MRKEYKNSKAKVIPHGAEMRSTSPIKAPASDKYQIIIAENEAMATKIKPKAHCIRVKKSAARTVAGRGPTRHAQWCATKSGARSAANPAPCFVTCVSEKGSGVPFSTVT